MIYARHIGRVGALAVALGVGMAVATTPGIAYAQPSDSASPSSPGDTQSATAPSSTDSSAAAGDSGTESPASVPESVPDSTDSATQTIGGDDGSPVVVIGSSGGAQAADDEDSAPADDDEDAPAGGDDDTPAVGDDEESTAGDAARSGGSTGPSVGSDGGGTAPTSTIDDTESLETDADQADGSDQQPLVALSSAEVAGASATYTSAAAVSADALTTASVDVDVPPPPVPTVWDIADDVVNTVVSVATQLISGVVTQLLDPATGSTQNPLLWLMAAFARKEFETLFASGPTVITASADEVASLLVDPLTKRVLVIGVDGMNLSKVLEDPTNTNFFDLMSEGVTSASTLVGHSSVSNPSWTGVQTGVWSERSGVINNVYTPWTYDTWPTVYNQIEAINQDIKTMAVVDGSINAPIAGAGSMPADEIFHFDVADFGDNWFDTDDAVGAKTVEVLAVDNPDTPNFLFTSFAGVDNMGHQHGGDSDEYKEAVHNIDENLGAIMAAVKQREADLGEDWTVILTTDHGHVGPETLGGRGHGFQSPRETSIMMIARDKGDVFDEGFINNTFRNVDVTPTVLRLFGLETLPDYFDGKPLMDRVLNQYKPDQPGQTALKRALNDALDMYGYPDSFTSVALNFRVLTATVPYLVDDLNNTIIETLEGVPVVGTVLAFPVNVLVGGFLYESLNIPAQVIARITGVTGNQIIPPDLLTRLSGGLIQFQLPQFLATVPPAAAPVCDDGSLLGAACLPS